MLALSVAAVLAVFLLYVSIAGGRTRAALAERARAGTRALVSLVGRVVGPVQRRAATRSNGLRFRVADINGQHAACRSSTTAACPDLFKLGRDVVVDGRYAHGVFVAKRDTLVTKCPSKYAPAKS